MSSIRTLIKEKRIEKKYTMKELAEKVGVSEATVSRWESGEISNMRRDGIMRLSEVLDIPPSVILGLQDNTRLNFNRPKGVRIPVLGEVVAGVPIDAVEEYLDWEEITPELAETGEFFALKIKGDSMEPRIVAGDVVIVKMQSTADTGDVVIAMVNGDNACCKRFIKQSDGIILQSFNSAYTPMFFTKEDIEKKPVSIIGKVIENRQKY